MRLGKLGSLLGCTIWLVKFIKIIMSKSAFNPPIPIAPKPVSILIIYTILDRDCLGKKYITLPRLDEENLRKVEDVIMEKCHINGDTFGTIVNIIRLDN